MAQGSNVNELSNSRCTLFAAVTGFLMVGIQVGGLLYAYRKEKGAEETEEDEEGSGAADGAVQETANPLEAGDEADETE